MRKILASLGAVLMLAAVTVPTTSMAKSAPKAPAAEKK